MKEKNYEWAKYYQKTANKKPSRMLVSLVEQDLICNRCALDLGAGALSETDYLINKGFSVVAIDASLEFGLMKKEFLKKKLADVPLKMVNQTFAQYNFPKRKFGIVNARYSLPFCPPTSFDSVFKKIEKSIVNGGHFVGQLFGENDEWNKNGSNMTFHTKETAIQLFKNFHIKEFSVEEGKRPTLEGAPKFWHVFHIIAQKNKTI